MDQIPTIIEVISEIEGCIANIVVVTQWAWGLVLVAQIFHFLDKVANNPFALRVIINLLVGSQLLSQFTVDAVLQSFYF